MRIRYLGYGKHLCFCVRQSLCAYGIIYHSVAVSLSCRCVVVVVRMLCKPTHPSSRRSKYHNIQPRGRAIWLCVYENPRCVWTLVVWTLVAKTNTTIFAHVLGDWGLRCQTTIHFIQSNRLYYPPRIHRHIADIVTPTLPQDTVRMRGIKRRVLLASVYLVCVIPHSISHSRPPPRLWRHASFTASTAAYTQKYLSLSFFGTPRLCYYYAQCYIVVICNTWLNGWAVNNENSTKCSR